MRILVLGGSGQTGRLVIEEALRRGKYWSPSPQTTHYPCSERWALLTSPSGHTITALVRDEVSLSPHDGLTIVRGTPLSQEAVDAAFSASNLSDDLPNAVIMTLKLRHDPPGGTKHKETSEVVNLMTQSAQNVIESIHRHKNGATSRKLVVMSSQGSGESWASLPMAVRAVFWTVPRMRRALADHDGVAALVRSAAERAGGKELRFTLVRPCLLTEGDGAEVRVHPDDGKGAGLMPRISRRSVAAFLVDAAESGKYDGMAPVITN